MMSEPLYVDSAEKRSFDDVLKENERLKEAIRRLADQDATLSVVGGDVIVEMDATLTDAEREAIAWAAKQMQYIRADNAAATLRNLLERTGGGR